MCEKFEAFSSSKFRYIYTTALDVLGKARRPVEAFNVFQVMLVSNIDFHYLHCDSCSYNKLSQKVEVSYLSTMTSFVLLLPSNNCPHILTWWLIIPLPLLLDKRVTSKNCLMWLILCDLLPRRSSRLEHLGSGILGWNQMSLSTMQ